jgi:hypothetical protein
VFDTFIVRERDPSMRKEGNMTQVIGSDPTGPGVEGISTGGDGVFGLSQSSSGAGVDGFNTDIGQGVFGYSVRGTGVVGQGDNYGVAGLGVRRVGVYGYSVIGNGVVGEIDPRGFAGVYGYNNNSNNPTGYAGYFIGNVDVVGTLTKTHLNFKIDHPLDPANKYLLHSGVESPEMKNLYDGVAVLDAQGETIIELPLWFEALNQEFRYQLTPIGAPGPNLYIAEEIRDRRFKIAGGTPGMKVCWQITGSRKDAWAQANPLIVEQEKSAPERGRYRHPEVHGHSQEQSIARIHRPEVLRRVVEEQQQKARED